MGNRMIPMQCNIIVQQAKHCVKLQLAFTEDDVLKCFECRQPCPAFKAWERNPWPHLFDGYPPEDDNIINKGYDDVGRSDVDISKCWKS
jgi:hypothetical protein